MAKLWPALELVAQCESHSNHPSQHTAEAQATSNLLFLFTYSLIKREKQRGMRSNGWEGMEKEGKGGNQCWGQSVVLTTSLRG